MTVKKAGYANVKKHLESIKVSRYGVKNNEKNDQ